MKGQKIEISFLPKISPSNISCLISKFNCKRKKKSAGGLAELFFSIAKNGGAQPSSLHLPPASPRPCSRWLCHRHCHMRWVAACAVHRRGPGFCHCERKQELASVQESKWKPSGKEGNEHTHCWAPSADLRNGLEASLYQLWGGYSKFKSQNAYLRFWGQPIFVTRKEKHWLLSWL